MVPADVPSGSYVIPADVVSAAGHGNTESGFQSLSGLFKSKVGRGIPRPRRADGGIVPISVSHGEMILSPEEVEAAGGPAVLDKLVKTIRDDYRRHLAKLPGPRK